MSEPDPEDAPDWRKRVGARTPFEIVHRLSLAPLRRRRLVLPISIRTALLAAVSIVVDQGRDAIEIRAGATIGGYRVQFDKILAQMQAEVRICQVVSQLLQS